MPKPVFFLFLLSCAFFAGAQDGIPAVGSEKYDSYFFYNAPERAATQQLYVIYNEDPSIWLKLVLVKEQCQFEFTALADANPYADVEIDEDDEGYAYAAIEYVIKNDQIYLSVRIAEDKEKAKIVCVSEMENVLKCPPLSNQLMYSE
jgi:hypothetical protein